MTGAGGAAVAAGGRAAVGPPGVVAGTADAPRLVGARCRRCSVVTFPAQRSCPRCTAEAMDEELLPRRGTLWTWTVQGFRPKSPPYAPADAPEGFEPFGVGYVDLDGLVRVESRLTVADPDRLRIGMEVELTVVPYGRDAEGRELLTFAFRPVEDEGAGT